MQARGYLKVKYKNLGLNKKYQWQRTKAPNQATFKTLKKQMDVKPSFTQQNPNGNIFGKLAHPQTASQVD